MVYENLTESLMKADPTGKLYDKLYDAMISYHDESARLGKARTIGVTGAPQIPQLEINAEGRFQDLQRSVRDANHILTSHDPPLPRIPEDYRGLNTLVDQEMRILFKNRPRSF